VWKRTNARGKVTQTVYGSLEKQGVAQVTNAEKPLNYQELGQEWRKRWPEIPKKGICTGFVAIVDNCTVK